MKHILLIFLAFLLSLQPKLSTAQTELAADLNSYIQKAMEDYQLPGFAIVVFDSNEVIYKNAFGVANMYTQKKVTSQSLFHMASVTKTFVVTALMKLQEEGKLDIDRPVTSVLPYFVLADDRYKQITVRQMMGHISGMPDFDSNPWHDAAYDDGALERFVRDFVSLKFLTADPGTKYQYCNTLYEVLGDVIAKASGMSFEAYVHENILEPLGMTNSTLLFREVDKTLLTSPHYLKDGKVVVSDIYPYNRMHGPSSTLVSNLEDMIHFMQMYLNGGMLNDVRILKTKTIEEMWSPAAGRFDNIGIGWHFRDHNGHRVIYHSGSDVGYKSYVWMIPDESLGIVFMTNSIAPPTSDFSKDMTDILLERSNK